MPQRSRLVLPTCHRQCQLAWRQEQRRALPHLPLTRPQSRQGALANATANKQSARDLRLLSSLQPTPRLGRPENAAPGGQITIRLLPSLQPSSSSPQERLAHGRHSLETCSLQAPRGTKTDPDRRFPEHMQHGYADPCRPAALLLHLHKEREWLDLSLS